MLADLCKLFIADLVSRTKSLLASEKFYMNLLYNLFFGVIAVSDN